MNNRCIELLIYRVQLSKFIHSKNKNISVEFPPHGIPQKFCPIFAVINNYDPLKWDKKTAPRAGAE